MKHYLMVHDLVWINTTMTGRPTPFSHERLEAAIAAQYDYGPQGTPEDNAGEVMHMLLTDRPFAAGNRRTALVAALALLYANGCVQGVTDPEAADLVRRAATGEITAQSAVAALARTADAGLPPGATLRQLVTALCNAHRDALAHLAEGDE